MKSKLLVPLGLGLALVSTVPIVMAQAAPDQPMPGGQPGEHRHGGGQRGFDAMDTNHDGVVTLDEWKAAGRREDRFAEINTARDGKITREQLRAFMEKMRAMREQNGGGGDQHQDH